MAACLLAQSSIPNRPVKLLFLGDIMGRSGRTAITTHLPRLRQELGLDFVVANAENATSGAGLSADHANLILDAGVDVITLGDHAFDNRDMLSFVEKQNRVLRPINIAKTAPGVGARVYDAPSGRKVMVAQVLGQVFMKQPYADPFSAIETALRKAPLGRGAHAVVVDFHAEATSEKMAMGHWLDGKASLVVGTHTHVPTADLQVLPKGTAFQSDAGMCGSYLSVIGMEKSEPLRRFITGMRKERFTPDSGEATLCGTFVETDNQSGLALRTAPLRVGGRLSQSLP